MKRGFKAAAEKIATEVRAELNLSSKNQLNVFALAEHLSIPVFTLNEVANGKPNVSFVRCFSGDGCDSFSAVTIFHGYRRCIVHNEHHHPHRQASNLAHELSHVLLEHEPTPLVDHKGQRHWNAEVEEEAHWLGAVLLVPREGALAMLKAGCTLPHIAAHYGVSCDLCNWRIRKSGVEEQTRRWRRRWRS